MRFGNFSFVLNNYLQITDGRFFNIGFGFSKGIPERRNVIQLWYSRCNLACFLINIIFNFIFKFF